MLRCNMNTETPSLQLQLDDLLGGLQHCRRRGDMGRLALLSYCEVRRWARQAGEQALAEHSFEMIVRSPHANREAFMAQVDVLIGELEQARGRTAATPQAIRA